MTDVSKVVSTAALTGIVTVERTVAPKVVWWADAMETLSVVSTVVQLGDAQAV